MGFYQVVRYLGVALGSAVAASILAGNTEAGQQLPTEGGYILVLWIAVAVCLIAAALAWLLPARSGRLSQGEESVVERDAALGPSGYVELPND
jgi:hypothetical protein